MKNTCVITIPVFTTFNIRQFSMNESLKFLCWQIHQLFKEGEIAPWVFDVGEMLEETLDHWLSVPFSCSGAQPRCQAICPCLHIRHEVSTIIRRITDQISWEDLKKFG